jgi:ABC-2 type transport system ATP-binding protein
MDARDGDVVVDVDGLRMRYGHKDVLDGVAFRVHRGEVIALLGPNGAGKTTTIEILEGFRVRSAGEVSVLGVDPAVSREDWRARVGIVLQSWRDHTRWRVKDLLGHLGRYYAPYSTAARARPIALDDLLAMVGLAEHADQMVGKLSGGERRRLDLAIGIVGHRSCCSSMSRRPGSTRMLAGNSTTSCTGWPISRRPPSCSRLMISPRRRNLPIAS